MVYWNVWEPGLFGERKIWSLSESFVPVVTFSTYRKALVSSSIRK